MRGRVHTTRMLSILALALGSFLGWTSLRPSSAGADPVHGTWRQAPPPVRAFAAGVHDPVRNRLLVLGGTDLLYRDDVWALPLSGGSSPEWSKLDSLGTPPIARFGHSAVYDPLRDRVIVFGGDTPVLNPANDTWELTLSGSPAWNPIAPGGPVPSPRLHHAAIYDPLRDRLLVYGGYDGDQPLGDLWELSLDGDPTWTQIAAAGEVPPARYGHAAAYDPVRDRLIVFGGYGGFDAGQLADVWALDLADTPEWIPLTPAGAAPAARSGATMTYDPARDRMAIVGGYDGRSFRNDVWALTLGGSPSWIPIVPIGPEPSPRHAHVAIHDTGHDGLVLFGGYDASMEQRGDVWTLSFAGGGSWCDVTPSPAPPRRRYGAVAVYDPVGERMLLFGGGNGALDDLWEFSADSGIGAWHRLEPLGTPPPGRISATAVYDAARARMLVFGGIGQAGTLNDVWELSLATVPTWRACDPSNAPPPGRYRHTAILDPARDRMVIFGGQDAADALLGDLWELSLDGEMSWSPMTPSGVPPSARFESAAIYDPSGDRMVLFGGYDGNHLGDTWSLSLAGSPEWTVLSAAGPPPEARGGHSMIYDPARGCMVVFGGIGAAPPYFLGDVWALALGDTPAWSVLAPAGGPPMGRWDAAAVYDVRRDRMIAFGGGRGFYALDETWILDWGDRPTTPAPCATCETSVLALEQSAPNPAIDRLVIRFSLAARARVALRVYDVAGRLVRSLVEDVLEAGPHTATWNRTTDAGTRAPAGVYLYELWSAGERRTRRLVLVN